VGTGTWTMFSSILPAMACLARLCLTVTCLVFLSCAETPMAGARRNSAAKSFRNPPFDRANIYVYRIKGGWDADLFVDDVRVTTLPNWSFIVLPVRPGMHTVAAHFVTQSIGTPKDYKNSEFELYAGGGSNYFVEQSGFEVGLVYRELTLEKVDPEDGKEGVRNCTLVADKPRPLPPP
jgi:hypothetical protein